MKTILEYMGAQHADWLVEGAKDSGDAIKKLGDNPKTFKPPVVNMPLYWNIQQSTDWRVDCGLE